MTDPFDAAAHEAAASGGGQADRTEWFWVELALVRERWRPSRHPFLGALACGDLTVDDRTAFVGELDHIVVALAGAAREAARQTDGLLADTLEAHAAGRDGQVARWRDLARGVGAGMYYGADPHEGTTTCAQLVAGTDAVDVAGHLVALHTLACAERDVWALAGRARGDWFDHRDVLTAACRAAIGESDVDRLQAALRGVLPQADPFALLRRAAAINRAYWHMLDDLDAYRDLTSGELT